ncbi:MAG TPA: outer membrane beta-barrel protein [Steroidobacteraceae bacterium]|nr:outer membrane beta-barrel protein [Steroidobacteraceae bacterium]
MKDRPLRKRSSLGLALAGTALILCSAAAPISARADDLLGFYVGGAFGQAHVRAHLDGLNSSGGTVASLGAFDGTHSAFQGMLGVRLLSFLGAEVTYMDLGQHSIRGPGQPVPGISGSAVTGEQVSQKGEAAFALLYLPVPIIDVYVKAGVSRIKTDMRATYALTGVGTCQLDDPGCATATIGRSPSDVGFAFGAGVQWKLGSWAVRGEYERFDAAGANPSLLSVGMTYWLL